MDKFYYICFNAFELEYIIVASVYIVSDSNIFLSALEQALEGQFQHIEKSSSLSRLVTSDVDWSQKVLIVDSGQAKDSVEQILRFRHLLTEAKVILVMRASQSLEDYRAVLPIIGALLPDSASVQEIVLTARIVGQGIALLPRIAIATLFPSLTPQLVANEAGNELAFTEREQAVLSLISKGASNKVIGRQLDISESTVRVHVRAILRKLGMQNRTQAALYAAGRRTVAFGAELLRPASAMVSAMMLVLHQNRDILSYLSIAQS